MRNPNGYGSVVKLSGKRRRPFAARKTIGWRDSGYPIYRYIGYYKTRKEAIMGLAEYNKSPYDLDFGKITLKELYEKWYNEKAVKRFAESTLRNRRSGFNLVSSIHDRPFRELTANDMELACNGRMSALVLLRNLDEYAAELGIVSKRNSEFVKIKTERKSERTVFSEEEIGLLWRHTDKRACRDALILIYTGLRIGELLSLGDSNLKDGYLVAGSKTEAGKNRVIPIHHRIADLITEYLNDDKLKYNTFRRYWDTTLGDLGILHTVHECRHTCRSRLDSAGVRNTTIDLIMGHKNGSTGERVYTHKTIEELKAAIETVV